MTVVRHVCVLPGLIWLFAGSALAQAPADVAGVESATDGAPARVLFADPIGEERRARAERVRQARAENDPFQPSGVWLPPFYLADAERSVEWIGLLYVDAVDFEEGSRARLLAPFVLSLEGPEERTLITPLFGGREDAEGEAGYAGNYVWRRDRLADADVVFPFFWSFRERDLEDGPDARSAGAVAPFVFWRRRTSGEHWTIAPPLFWRWGDAQETTTIAGPAFVADSPGRSWFGALPLYLGRRNGDGGAFDAALPLLLLRTSDAEGHLLLSPFVVSRSDLESTTTVVPPALFVRHADAEGSSTFALNTYYGTRRGGSTLWSFPLFWHRADPGEHDTGVVPFWFGGERDGGRRRYDVVPPLLFGRAHDEDAGTTDTFAVNTFLRLRPDGFTLASFPLLFAGSTGDESYAVAPPLFWRFVEPGQSDTGILPLYFGGESEGGRRRYDVVPPLLFGRASQDDAGTSQTLLLNTYYASRPDGYTLASFPLLFAGRDGADAWAVAPPLLFGRSADEEEGTSATYLLNTYYGSRPDGHTLASFPLLFSGRAGASSYTVVPPLLFGHTSDEEAGTSSTFLLNTYYGSRPDGYTLASFPLLFAGRDREESYTVVPPLVWSFEAPGRSDAAVLPFWVGGERTDAGSRYDVVPPLLYGRSTDREAGTSSTFLLNTYYASRPDGYTLASFPFAFGWRDGDEEALVLPPALTYHDNDGETSRTFALNTYLRLSPDSWAFAFAPLLFAGGTADESHLVAFPLLWRFAGPTSLTTIAAPFFYTRASDGAWHTGFAPLWFSGRLADGSRYDLAPPLVWRFDGDDGTRLAVLPLFDYSRDATRTRVISPVMYHRTDADGVEGASSKTVVLGLYWDFRGPERRTRVAFPLWWQHEDTTTGRGLSTLFPLYWRRQGLDETTHVLFNAAWTNQHDGPGWSFHLFPLFDLASDAADHLRWQVAGGLFGRESRGARHRWRLMYAWTEPTEE